MFENPDWPLHPTWLEGERGRLFALVYPAPENRCNGAVVCLPPFAEDMNRCRNMAAMQARSLAASGFSCLIFDLFGTGESEGEFEAASWQTWIQDSQLAADWLRERCGHEPVLWGIRSGALLAGELANRHPERFRRLLFWQPVTDGKSMLTQFLRIRVANLMDFNRPAETTKEMRQQMQAGESIEVTGYILAPELGLPLDECRLADFTRISGCRVDWLEHISEAGKPLPIGAQKAIDSMSAANAVNAQGFQGPAFWKLGNRVWAPELIAKTLEVIAG